MIKLSPKTNILVLVTKSIFFGKKWQSKIQREKLRLK